MRKLLSRLIADAEQAGLAGSAQDGNGCDFEARGNREAFVDALLQSSTDSAQDLEELDPEHFLSCIVRHMPGLKASAVETLRRIPGGRSKSTILCDITTDSGVRSLVLRKDFAASITGSSVLYEYPLLIAARSAGLPVPEVLWIERDPSMLDGACICFEKMNGDSAGTLYESRAPASAAIDLAAALARLHAIDIDRTGLADQLRDGRSATPVGDALDAFERRYHADMDPTPLVDRAFDWLRSQVGRLGDHRAFVHGDASFHNILVSEGRMTALLDWELAHAGDPAEDLAYVKHLAQHILPWRAFMAAYEDHGGVPVSDLRLRFFEIWRPLGLALIAAKATRQFQGSEPPSLRLAAIAADTMPRQLHDLALALDRAMSPASAS